MKHKLTVLSAVPLPQTCSTDGSGVTSTSTSCNDVPNTNNNNIQQQQQPNFDHLDEFNHPRERRNLILLALVSHPQCQNRNDDDNKISHNVEIEYIPCSITSSSMDGENEITTATNDDVSSILQSEYGIVHTTGLISFLDGAWDQWVKLGIDGRDPIGSSSSLSTLETNDLSDVQNNIPCLIPSGAPLLRYHPNNNNKSIQRPSNHVIGQMGYYCTDRCTPIFSDLRNELISDAMLVRTVKHHIVSILNDIQHSSTILKPSTYYILPYHPGHHAATDCFGGYCYLNHIAAMARSIHISSPIDNKKVVILDIDYHCGNGTAAIFDTDPNIFVISIHCDPNYDYPFHIGYADDTGSIEGNHTTYHLPLPPGTGWTTGYCSALTLALERLVAFNPCVVLISLGLDTYEHDPCAIRRAGFALKDTDYVAMGQLLATYIDDTIPTVFVQEGGYRMDTIGQAAADVVVSFTSHRNSKI